MRDIFDKEIKVGDRVLYFTHGTSAFCERATVIEINDYHLILEFSGGCSQGEGGQSRARPDGSKSRKITAAASKIQIIMTEENFRKELKDLKRENEKLQAEVEKIHSRFDIMEL